MVVPRKGRDMCPPSMGRVIVPIDGAIHLLPIPVMSKTAFLHLRPPEIDVTFINDKHSELGIDPVGIDDYVSKFLSGDPFQLGEVNHHTCSSNAAIRFAFAVR